MSRIVTINKITGSMGRLLSYEIYGLDELKQENDFNNKSNNYEMGKKFQKVFKEEISSKNAKLLSSNLENMEGLNKVMSVEIYKVEDN